MVEIDNTAHADEEKDGLFPIPSNETERDADLDKIKFDRMEAGDFDFDSTNDNQNVGMLGLAGWELVAATPEIETTHPIGNDAAIAAVRTSKIVLIFKRPLGP